MRPSEESGIDFGGASSSGGTRSSPRLHREIDARGAIPGRFVLGVLPDLRPQFRLGDRYLQLSPERPSSRPGRGRREPARRRGIPSRLGWPCSPRPRRSLEVQGEGSGPPAGRPGGSGGAPSGWRTSKRSDWVEWHPDRQRRRGMVCLSRRAGGVPPPRSPRSDCSGRAWWGGGPCVRSPDQFLARPEPIP